MTERRRRFRRLCGAIMLSAITMIGVGGAVASPTADTLGLTTVEQRVVANSDPDFRELALGPGQPYSARELDDATPLAQAGREARRTSLVYFGQLSDFQLADEESPAEVAAATTGSRAATATTG